MYVARGSYCNNKEFIFLLVQYWVRDMENYIFDTTPYVNIYVCYTIWIYSWEIINSCFRIIFLLVQTVISRMRINGVELSVISLLLPDSYNKRFRNFKNCFSNFQMLLHKIYCFITFFRIIYFTCCPFYYVLKFLFRDMHILK